MSRPFISFLTDFGPDGPAAVCRGVMLAIAPDASIVDIAHGVRKFAIRDGAILFASALPYFRVGVAVGVVDPGVGTERLPIAIRTGRGDLLVGPDNGLFRPVAQALGGIMEARVHQRCRSWPCFLNCLSRAPAVAAMLPRASQTALSSPSRAKAYSMQNERGDMAS